MNAISAAMAAKEIATTMMSNHGMLVPPDARQGRQHSILADPKRCAVLPRAHLFCYHFGVRGAWVCTTGISVARLHLSLHDGADDLNGEARSPWSTRSETGLN
jgi:hypothetical protein